MPIIWPKYPSISTTDKDCTHIAMLGIQDYASTLEQMRSFTRNRDAQTPDQIWLLEHPPIYTRGRSSTEQDILSELPYPIVDTDRGGQITYHGPGQLIVYYLIDTRRLVHINLRGLIDDIEHTILAILSSFKISANTDSKARGVYVAKQKIASIGLRSTKQGTYHGFALNVCAELAPFTHINPCGRRQKMVNIQQLSDQVVADVVTQSHKILADSKLLKQRLFQLSSSVL